MTKRTVSFEVDTVVLFDALRGRGEAGQQALGRRLVSALLAEPSTAERLGMALYGVLDAPSVPVARPLDEWHEELGDVLWWRFPVEEPPWVGTPLTLGRTVAVQMRAWEGTAETSMNVGGWPGYHTHFTPMGPLPVLPGEGSK